MKVWVVKVYMKDGSQIADGAYADEGYANHVYSQARDMGFRPTIVEHEVSYMTEDFEAKDTKAMNALDPAILLDSLKSMTKEQRSEFFFECYRAECETLGAMNVGPPMTLRGFDGTPITFGP